MYNKLDDTICAVATAPGTGAIAVIRLSGKDAIAIANKFFGGKNLLDVEGYTAHFGQIKLDERIIDEVIATVFKAPKSFTGENVVEISCHGSVYIQQELIKSFIDAGARAAEPGEFTLRAFLNGKMDLSQAEAVADLISADSTAAHKLAMQQMRGGFSDEINALREKLIHFASMIELELDFSEEDVAFANRDELKALVLEMHKKIDNLILSFATGNVFKRGVPIAIAGRPNAGKSTLLNTLLNEVRAIVSEIAGTTRDTIEEQLNIKGVGYRFIDTAGIRESQDSIESMGIKKTMEKIEQAEILLYIFDAVHITIAEALADVETINKRHIPVILVANKIDLMAESRVAALKGHFTENEDGLCLISAKEKQHIEALKEKLCEITLQKHNTNYDVIVSNSRHYEALKHTNSYLLKVLDDLESEISGDLLALDIRAALNYLGEITGQITTDNLLDNIFRNFCIGK